MRRLLRDCRNLAYRSLIKTFWRDYSFRFFVADAVKRSDHYDLRLTRSQMAGMTQDEADFFRFVIGHKSHAQNAQDLWALFESNGSGKFFVEFGATDGVDISNTILLEREYGWTGILAEPNPAWHAALRKNRNAVVEQRCVHSLSGELLPFATAADPSYGGVTGDQLPGAARFGMKAGKIQVETISLNDLLAVHHAPDKIDFMSIDTEGWEYEILKTFDFKRWDVRLFCIESGPAEKDQAINRLMAENGYVRRLEKFSAFDAWYRKA